MANYFEMTRDELTAEKAALEENYKKFQAMGLKLNMARGKPGPHQMDLAMGLLLRLPRVSLPLVAGGEAQVPLPGTRL